MIAKLLVVALIIRLEFLQIHEPFLPFWALFDEVPSPALFRRGLQAVFFLASAGILFNRRLRLSCVALAGALLLSILACRVDYSNNRLFAAALLAMIGLDSGEGAPFLRWQIALVYAGAALNKALDPDWRSGLFFANFMDAFQIDLLLRAAERLPFGALAAAASWGTIALEAGLSALWLTGARPAATIWLVLIFHTLLTTLAGTTFGVFYAASVAAALLLVRRPATPVVVHYDADSRLCAKTRAVFEALDFDSTMRWTPLQSAPGHALSEAAKGEHFRIIADGRVSAGFMAFKEMILLMPVSYLAALLLWAPFTRHSCPRPALAAAWAVLLCFFPLFEPVGERIYLAIARSAKD
ncbi:MAG: hypothetical protein HY059_09615 [Proteobacteria bacterium]|nr:hypothetical protein [Pseudomonadota bacterium]